METYSFIIRCLPNACAKPSIIKFYVTDHTATQIYLKMCFMWSLQCFQSFAPVAEAFK